MSDFIQVGNCAELLKKLPDEYVALTITSPPYDDLRDYHGFAMDIEVIAKELWRVSKPGGIIVWVVGDAVKHGTETGTSFRHAQTFMKVGFFLHDTMIFVKSNPPPRSTQHKRYEQGWEYMFVFSKGRPLTWNPIMVPSARKKGGSKWFQKNGILKNRHSVGLHPLKLRNNLWQYPVGQEKNGHPAVFPLALAIDHVKSWSNPGDLVLDPFAGSGTTGIAALQEGRGFLGMEISPIYAALAEKRLSLL
jgi:DNA modification methylase